MLRLSFINVCAALFGIMLTGTGSLASADFTEFTTYKYRGIECIHFDCARLKSHPRVSLLSVNPNPLPAVNPGASQTVDLEWAVEHGLKSIFSLCITSGPGAQPATKDRCIQLRGDTISSTSRTHVNFTETATLSASLRRPEAGFYIRSTQSLFFFGTNPQVQVSNVKPFVWPYRMTNLNARSAGVDVFGSTITAEVDVRNTSSIDATDVEVLFIVNSCNGNEPAPLRENPSSSTDWFCQPTASTHLSEREIRGETVPYLAAGDGVNVVVDITSLLPANPRNLYVSVIAIVDPDNDIDETDETSADNSDDGSLYIPRP